MDIVFIVYNYSIFTDCQENNTSDHLADVGGLESAARRPGRFRQLDQATGAAGGDHLGPGAVVAFPFASADPSHDGRLGYFK